MGVLGLVLKEGPNKELHLTRPAVETATSWNAVVPAAAFEAVLAAELPVR
jgi:hypothetical protein